MQSPEPNRPIDHPPAAPTTWNGGRECGRGSLWRRTVLKAAGLCGCAWLTPMAEALAIDAEKQRRRPKSVILLWLDGGPSQIETFDPHPGSEIAAGSTAIATRVADVQLGKGLEQLADQMDVVTLVRNVVSKEGDHERAVYNFKTGFRPDPTLVHPSIGAVLCHQLPVGGTEIPRHVSILPTSRFGRGGYLGNHFDAFQIDHPGDPVPDVSQEVNGTRFERRLADLALLDREFYNQRTHIADAMRQQATIDQALRMMDSEQLTAFHIHDEPGSVRSAFGDAPFGRGCLAALRLIQVGVRCVEVTLTGWDSHFNNHSVHDKQKKVLDPAIASLIRELRRRDLLDDTIVVCGGEFGRTPTMNPAGGRDHWPHGFSIAIAGGGIRQGGLIGATDPNGGRLTYAMGTPVENIHASLLTALGVDFATLLQTPVGRPIAISEGHVIPELLR